MAIDKIRNLEKQWDTLRDKPNKGYAGRKKVDILNQLASALADSQLLQSATYAKQAVKLSQRINYEKGIAEGYSNLGWSCFSRSDNTRALRNFAASLKIYLDIGDKQGAAKLCKSIGMTYGLRSEYDKASAYLFRALRICRNIRKKNTRMQIASNVYMEIGNLYGYQSDYVEQLEYYFKALEIIEEIDDKKQLSCVNLNIGTVYAAQNDFKRALKHFSVALRIAEKIANKPLQVSAFGNIGNIYGEMRRWDKALVNFLESLRIAKDIGAKADVATAAYSIANYYVEKKAYRKASSHLSDAFKILEEIGDDGVRAAIYNLSGHINTQLKKLDVAARDLDKGLESAHRVNSKWCLSENYRRRSDLYAARHDHEQALELYKKCRDIEKETLNHDKNKQIAELRTAYETEKKEREAVIYRLKNVKLRKEMKERKKAEEELKKHRGQLEQLVQERTAQLRSLAHELSLVEEKERRKIAAYLHDEVNQKLAIAAFKLDSIEKVKSVAQIRKEHREIKKIIDQIAQLTRSLTFEISPPILYEFGLESAIEWLVRQFSKQHRIPCEFKHEGDTRPLADDTRTLLFQSVRELLANVAKHAHASSVIVSAARDDNVIRITVSDNGIGFDPEILKEKIAENEGFGLFNVQERLKHLKGRLSIESAKGHGTAVTIIAPLGIG